MSDKALEETKAALETAKAEKAKALDEVKVYKAQNEQLVTERDAAIARAETAEKSIAKAEKAKSDAETEAEVDALVSVKIAPSEKASFLELRRTNLELFTRMIEQRRPMTHLERSAGNDYDPNAGNSHTAIDDDGAGASAALDNEAGC